MNNTRKCRLWFVRETPSGRLYSKLPQARNPSQADMVWLPRSQIEHTSKHNATDLTEHILTLPEWLANEKDL
jgi:hypothetical protein